MTDPSCPFDTRVVHKDAEKIANYEELKNEVAPVWKLKRVEVIYIAIEALATVTKKLLKVAEKVRRTLSG